METHFPNSAVNPVPLDFQGTHFCFRFLHIILEEKEDVGEKKGGGEGL